jgi:hypothetical protein
LQPETQSPQEIDMEHSSIATSALGLVQHPAPNDSAGAEKLDFTVLAFFMTANFLITLGLFAVGIVVVGLFYDHFRPWFKHHRNQRRDHKRLASR